MKTRTKINVNRSVAHNLIIAASLLAAIGLHFCNPQILLLYIALLSSSSLALLLRRSADRSRLESEHAIDLPFAIAHDKEVYDEYVAIAKALKHISQIPDQVFREAALQQIAVAKSELERVAEGTLTFEGTESWRLVYESLLRSNHVFLYRSAAWVKSSQYWQDEPGKQSAQLNLHLVDRQHLNIERIFILSDSVWPPDQRFPSEPILGWIDEHHRHGMWIKLVRESAIANETDLLSDFGIYGSHAVGEQIQDDKCRTIRFILRFNFEAVVDAEKRWQRLGIYSQAYRDLLETN
ncbi:MAG: hypothetical protein SFV81_17385 [Pirellulaceae bacterium]|nr:hypothetical protein [Pirellulaceae bacterium]